MGDFQELIDFGNLYNSCQVSLKGKGKKQSAIRFSVDALENILLMKKQLIEHTYKVGQYNEFIIFEPKRRIVKSGTFRDKVLQHCLCDYVLLPKLKDVFILDNYAGQIGKGTLFGLNRLSEKLLDYYNKYGSEGYILKCDITKFFYSINHDLLKICVNKYFQDPDVRWVCNLFIDSSEEIGLPLGNQVSQVFGLMYLNGIDHYIVEELGIEYYGRYMDDFYLLSNDKEKLKECLQVITKLLDKLKLTLNNKTEIVPMKKGIRFLGFHTYLTNNGKVIRKLTGDNKRQIKKKLRKNAELVKLGKISRRKFDEKYISWKNHASHGNCYRLICSMDKYVESLFEQKENISNEQVCG